MRLLVASEPSRSALVEAKMSPVLVMVLQSSPRIHFTFCTGDAVQKCERRMKASTLTEVREVGLGVQECFGNFSAQIHHTGNIAQTSVVTLTIPSPGLYAELGVSYVIFVFSHHIYLGKKRK